MTLPKSVMSAASAVIDKINPSNGNAAAKSDDKQGWIEAWTVIEELLAREDDERVIYGDGFDPESMTIEQLISARRVYSRAEYDAHGAAEDADNRRWAVEGELRRRADADLKQAQEEIADRYGLSLRESGAEVDEH